MMTLRRTPWSLMAGLAVGVATLAAGAPRGGAQEAARFDHLVRADFFAGLRGDTVAFGRAMRLLQDTLAAHPGHAEALAWHGAGLLHLAGRAFGAGRFREGGSLWDRGMEEMDRAVALAPENVGVLLPRGATLLAASREVPSRDEAARLLERGVRDYEKVLELQRPYFGRLPQHSRCELLAGLADGWHRLGRPDTARAYFQRVASECEGTGYADEAKAWLAGEDGAPGIRTCRGCHAPG